MEDVNAVTFSAMVHEGRLVLSTEGDGFRRRVFVPVDRLSEIELTTSPMIVDGFVLVDGGGAVPVCRVEVRWWATEEMITSVGYSFPPQEAEKVYRVVNLALADPGRTYVVPAPPAGKPKDGFYRLRDNFGNVWTTEHRIPMASEDLIVGGDTLVAIQSDSDLVRRMLLLLSDDPEKRFCGECGEEL
jgi:hypothetical protein